MSVQERTHALMQLITCFGSPLTFRVGGEGEFDNWLQITGFGPDWSTGETKEHFGRKWRLSEFMTDSEIVNTAFMATLAFIEHELREAFKFKGQPIYMPHFDVHDLADAMASGMWERDARKQMEVA